MKYAAVIGAAALFALSACSESETPAPEATASETATAEAPAALSGSTAAYTAGQAPSKEFLVGKWGEGEGCELAMTFNADGSITDGPADAWTLFSMTLKVVDENTMESLNEGGGKATLKRCS